MGHLCWVFRAEIIYHRRRDNADGKREREDYTRRHLFSNQTATLHFMSASLILPLFERTSERGTPAAEGEAVLEAHERNQATTGSDQKEGGYRFLLSCGRMYTYLGCGRLSHVLLFHTACGRASEVAQSHDLPSDPPCGCDTTFGAGFLQQGHALVCEFLDVYLSFWYEQVSLLQHWSEREPSRCSPFEANCPTANDQRQ